MSYYEKKYFEWQKEMGEFGGKANLFKFKEFIKETYNVLDFGCGGGYLLSNITASKKLGVEINDYAREIAKKNGINTVRITEDVPDDWADIIISNSVLEHTFSPLDELKKLHPKLKYNGKIVFVVPQEINMDYYPNDVNQHLYTWSPMCIGNLFTTANFIVEKVETIKHMWPTDYYLLRKYAGEYLFNAICRFYSKIQKKIFQIRVIAHK